MKIGMGYQGFTNNISQKLIHSGKYFYGGYYYQFGEKFRNKIQFQVANSNREMKFDFPYVSAATSLAIYYDLNYRIKTTKKSAHYLGCYFGDFFTLNFFPRIDHENFLWENQFLLGLSSMNNIRINHSKRIDINFRLPVFTSIHFNKMDRFDGDVPYDLPSNWVNGSFMKLLNAQYEIGYVFGTQGFTFGIYYQEEHNMTENTLYGGFQATAHSISFRIIY